jgi:hypothetical protein
MLIKSTIQPYIHGVIRRGAKVNFFLTVKVIWSFVDCHGLAKIGPSGTASMPMKTGTLAVKLAALVTSTYTATIIRSPRGNEPQGAIG